MNPHPLKLNVYASPDDLPQALRCYAEVVPNTNLHVFKHPLWTDLFPVAVPLPIDELLLRKQEKIDSLLDDDDLRGFVFIHERAFRMDMLNDLWQSGTFDKRPKEYWQIARQVWTDSEQDEDDLRWTRLLEIPLPHREAMTTAEEWEALSREPERLTVYRGLHGYDIEDARSSIQSGWSWTLSPKTAAFFARRLRMNGRRGFVAKALAPRASVIAHFLSRGESEIVISSSDIDLDTLSISPVGEDP